MKPALIMSHNELNDAALQNLRAANARALGFDYARRQEGFPDMR